MEYENIPSSWMYYGKIWTFSMQDKIQNKKHGNVIK